MCSYIEHHCNASIVALLLSYVLAYWTDSVGVWLTFNNQESFEKEKNKKKTLTLVFFSSSMHLLQTPGCPHKVTVHTL